MRTRFFGRGASRSIEVLTVLLLTAATAAAQAPPPGAFDASTVVAAPTPVVPPNDPAARERLVVTTGRSTVLNTEFDIKRIALTNPAVADALVVQPRAVLIDGKTSGTISLIVWGETEQKMYDLVVEPGASGLQVKLQSLFPGENIAVSTNDDAIILSGQVSTNFVSLRAAEIAAATSAKSKVINLLQLPGGSKSQQVMLQVRFAEVSRRALTELGASFFTGANGYEDWVGRSTTQQFAAPDFDDGKLTFSDYLNLFLFNTKENVGAVIKALREKGLFQSLAEPNLIAYNGEEASFLAGGEIPIPVVQGVTGAVMIQFKEFGIRLNFRPTIAGDMIRLKVRPEVSTLDYGNGLIISGFRVPALATRRAETDVELRDGQSFAIAGLIDNVTQDSVQKVPGLGDIPIIGNLFKSRAKRTERTELLVLITPRLVEPLNPDQVPALPTDPKLFLPKPAGAGEALKGGGGTVDAPAMKPGGAVR